VTCLAIVGYSALHEGFTAHVASRGMTILDSERNRAFTVGVAGMYANLAPREAQFTNLEVLLAPKQYDSEPQVASIDWTNGTKLSSDFLPSRRYREWGVLSAQATRARLVVKRDGEAVIVQNALDSELARVFVRVGEQVYEASAVPRGGSTTLTKAGDVTDVKLGRFAEYPDRFYAPDQWANAKDLADGEFLAETADRGMLPLGGLSLIEHNNVHVFRGRYSR
jgi:hypothetical protein